MPRAAQEQRTLSTKSNLPKGVPGAVFGKILEVKYLIFQKSLTSRGLRGDQTIRLLLAKQTFCLSIEAARSGWPGSPSPSPWRCSQRGCCGLSCRRWRGRLCWPSQKGATGHGRLVITAFQNGTDSKGKADAKASIGQDGQPC
jgi:hypothetical protein